MPRPRTVVLYVLGKGRSGSTLLDATLGQLPGVFSTGELRELWRWGHLQGYDCSCGAPVRTCPIWSQVTERVLGTKEPSRAAVERVEALHERVLRWSAVPGLLAGRDRPALRAYVDLQQRLYDAIAGVTGAQVIVDSSKWPAHPGVLGRMPGVDPRVVHLVRDPRAVAFSYTRHRPTGGRQPAMPRFGPVHSSLSWLVRNATAEVARRRVPSLRVTYEAFAAEPRRTVAGIAALADRDPSVLPFVDDRTVRIGQTHMVGGNPGRFRTGEIRVEADDEWVAAMPQRDARLVTALTAPLRARYGYRRESVLRLDVDHETPDRDGAR